MAAHAAPVNVVFDYYGEPSAALSPRLRAVREAATRMVAELGEPWLSFFAPDDIAGELRAMGLDDVEDVAGPDLLARYVGEPAVGVDAFGGHVIRAGRATARR
ncbi:hypothetical protein GCM10020221_21540 [Streptomyces thioluteus]|uniref:SAM-dependent methyltransferase n=1 Tax=Streptomyces thioluteus TaxID=66431 RepID=A0ABN3WRL3_STRTU